MKDHSLNNTKIHTYIQDIFCMQMRISTTIFYRYCFIWNITFFLAVDARSFKNKTHGLSMHFGLDALAVPLTCYTGLFFHFFVCVLKKCE